MEGELFKKKIKIDGKGATQRVLRSKSKNLFKWRFSLNILKFKLHKLKIKKK